MRLADLVWVFDRFFDAFHADLKSANGTYGLIDHRPKIGYFFAYPRTARDPGGKFTSELELACWLADKEPA